MDGPLTSAKFYTPGGISVDTSGIVFVADSNNVVRMISILGVVTTIAGATSAVSGIANGFGTNAKFYLPSFQSLTTDGKLYLADALNGMVRVVNLAGENERASYCCYLSLMIGS